MKSEELPGLAKSGFDAVGHGFYSVFMLGSQVRVTTRRFERWERDDADQWLLTFEGRKSVQTCALIAPDTT
ncbi:MAG: hypothetical protein ACREWE_07250 [Gammaproteobacteria bacterium]